MKLVKEAYNLSVPVGLGFIHARAGELTDDQAKSLINEDSPSIVVEMDYVLGRQCKFVVFKRGDRMYTHRRWYDHTDDQLRNLMVRVGVII